MRYTICFIRQGDNILLLNRERPGWMGRWNGVGGRVEAGENPSQAIIREIYEETGLSVNSVEFKGIVKWIDNGKLIGVIYAYITVISRDAVYETPQKTDEGILDWKHLDWIMHPENRGIAPDIPYYCLIC